MAKDFDLNAYIQAAAEADGPSLVAPLALAPGGVDPLGLRQINFDLMDEVLPHLNNVARHIRPFVVVTWAWRRVKHIAEKAGLAEISSDQMRDFVDRIEVIYAWSQFLRDPKTDLPGRQFLRPLIEASSWTFGGDLWQEWRDTRYYSTSLMAPVNYGPSLRTLGWIVQHEEHSDVMIATEAAQPALDAFEQKIAAFLKHPAFSKLGSVKVTAKDVAEWGEAWALEKPSKAERDVAARLVFGADAPAKRQQAGELMLAAAKHVKSSEPRKVRAAMAGAPSSFRVSNALSQSSLAWRTMQERQLFRLALEGLLSWIAYKVESGPKSTAALVKAFLKSAGGVQAKTRIWLTQRDAIAEGPVKLLDALESELQEGTWAGVAAAIADGLAYCMLNARGDATNEAPDRLPIARAHREAAALMDEPARTFITHVVESWVLAQHAYWSLGRGLADARVRGRSIMRLKVVLEEGGWSLAPNPGAEPVATADRLGTALSLARECGLLE